MHVGDAHYYNVKVKQHFVRERLTGVYPILNFLRFSKKILEF